MSQKKVQIKKTLGQQTEDQLMKYILDNQIAIGEKIPNEFELAGIFDVGRSTIREAVKGLVSRVGCFLFFNTYKKYLIFQHIKYIQKGGYADAGKRRFKQTYCRTPKDEAQ